MWCHFIMKTGWRDGRSSILQERVRANDLGGKPIETFFDLIDYDEGARPGGLTTAWL